MMGELVSRGHELTNRPEQADVLVVNTCSFIDPAKKESIDTILEMAEHKKNGGCRRLIVTGCMAERYRDELRAEIPEIDAVLGTGEVPGIVDALEGVIGGLGAGIGVSVPLLRSNGQPVNLNPPLPVPQSPIPVPRSPIPVSGALL